MEDNSTNNVYNYLIENYDHVTIENGYYHVTNVSNYGFEGFIPTSYNTGDPISVYTFTPGLGNTGISEVESMVQGENPPNCAIFIAGDYRTESSDHNIILQASTFANDNGMTIANLGAESFDLSGGVMLESVAQFASNPNNSSTEVTAVLTEGYLGMSGMGNGWDYNMDSSVYATLSSSENVSVYGIASTNPNNDQGSSSIANYTELARNGVNVVLINTDETGHEQKLSESIENGMTLYLMGLNPELGNSGDANYTPYTFVAGSFVENGDMSNYSGVDNTIFLTDEILDISEHRGIYGYGSSAEEHPVTTYKVQVPEKYDYLKELGDLNIKYSGQLDETIASNLTYITDSMNSIRSQIKLSGFMQGYSI